MTKTSLSSIAFNWEMYKKSVAYNELKAADISLRLIDRELNFLYEFTNGCLARAINWINAHISDYDDGNALLDYILNYCEEHDYLAKTFKNRFKRNTITNNERKK